MGTDTSNTFAAYTSISYGNYNALNIQGMVNLPLSDTVQFLYKCSDSYDPKDEHGIRWDDPDLGISWGLPNPLLSEKDRKYPTLGTVSPEFLPQYPAR